MPTDTISKPDAGTQTPIDLSSLKLWCYLACLTAFLLTALPADFCRMGLCILLIFAPLAAAHWLRSGAVWAGSRRCLWLLPALGCAFGLLSVRNELGCAACFCLSLLCWSVCLGCGVDASRQRTWREICLLVFTAGFYDPWSFFLPEPADDEAQKKRAARWMYVLYILGAALVFLILLLIQADGRINGILRVSVRFVLEKAPLLLSCLVLALFPAAIIYSFLSKLEAVSAAYRGENGISGDGCSRLFKEFPWPALCILLTVVNWFFLLVEIYCNVFQKSSLPVQEDSLYDIFAVILLIFIGLMTICCQIQSSEKDCLARRTALGVSLAGLVVFAGIRLSAHILSFGFWNVRIVLSVILLLFVLVLFGMVGFSSRGPHFFFQRTGIAVVVFLMLLCLIPSGVVLTKINASIFLYKYHTLQLDGQSGVSAEGPVELTSQDLCLERMESYGISGIPALTRLVDIEDVSVDGEALSLYVRNKILDCLCGDLGLTRTEDNSHDINAVFEASSDIPRYRLSVIHAWTIACLEDVKDSF